MLKTIALRSAFVLTLAVFATSSSRTMHAQSIDPPPQTNAVTGGDPQPTGEPPKGKGQSSVVDPDELAVLEALGLT